MPSTPPADRLKLRARDAEDLAVISACLQDAIVDASDITFLRRERRFVLLANRFRWEARAAAGDLPDAPPPGHGREGDARFEDAPLYERVHCALTFDRVRAVNYRGFRRAGRGMLLNLLAIAPERGAILLSFSGGAAIRLAARGILCHMEDLGEPWPTRWRPHHDTGQADEAGAMDAGARDGTGERNGRSGR